MSSVIAGVIEGFFGRLMSRFTTEDILQYVQQDLDLIEYTKFDQHGGTYNALVPLLNRIRPYSVSIILPLVEKFLTVERVLRVINMIPNKGREWLDILANRDKPKGYFWLKRNIKEIKEWAMKFFANPSFYDGSALPLMPEKATADPVDRKFQVSA